MDVDVDVDVDVNVGDGYNVCMCTFHLINEVTSVSINGWVFSHIFHGRKRDTTHAFYYLLMYACNAYVLYYIK